MTKNEELYATPEVSFIDGITAEDVKKEMYSDFDSIMEEITGEAYHLKENSLYGTLVNTALLKIYQTMQYVDRAGKMNLLKYSEGEFLRNLGLLRSVTANNGMAAICIQRFYLEEPLEEIIPIEVGTRVTAGDEIYFATLEYAQIEIGSYYTDVPITCLEIGEIGNGYDIGKLNILVDPIPFIYKVENIEVSKNGTEEESDEELREKIYLSPSGYSTAGTEDSYRFWVMKYDSSLQDVKVRNPQDMDVNLILVKKNGEIPDETYLYQLEQYIIKNNIIPMTDHVTALAAKAELYDIEFTYYLYYSDTGIEEQKKLIQEAVKTYIDWQQAKIGRDINPDYLRMLLVSAGAKRVDIVKPIFTVVAEDSIAKHVNEIVTFGGMEGD